jgi:hypothetical protein
MPTVGEFYVVCSSTRQADQFVPATTCAAALQQAQLQGLPGVATGEASRDSRPYLRVPTRPACTVDDDKTAPKRASLKPDQLDQANTT